MATHQSGSWHATSPFTRGLLGFLLLNGLVVNLALLHNPWRSQQMTTLRYTQAFLERTAHDDSWRPMRMALAHLDRQRADGSASGPGLYESVLFGQGVKFQYAPTSLLVLEPLRRSPFGDLTTDRALNGISWLAVIAMGLAMARIVVLTGERMLPEASRASPLDRALQSAAGFGFTLLFYPVVRAYYGGQIQTWIDLLFTLLLWSWLVDRRVVAGALGGAICVIKPALGPLLIWALLRRHWRFAGGFCAVAAAAGVASLALYGLDPHVEYLSVLSFISQHGESFHANQSVNGTLHRVLDNGPNLRWEASRFAPYHPWVHAGTVVSSLALLGGALFWRRQDAHHDDALDLVLAVTSFTIAAPIAWEHHYGVTLAVFAVASTALLRLRPRIGLGWLAALALAFALVSNNFRLLNRLAGTPWSFLQSYVLYGGLLLLASLYRLRRVAAGPWAGQLSSTDSQPTAISAASITAPSSSKPTRESRSPSESSDEMK